jgi:hypothetical protein
MIGSIKIVVVYGKRSWKAKWTKAFVYTNCAKSGH